jgi:hypothetical protein
MFQLSLVFYFTQACLQLLVKFLDHGGQKVCGCVPVAILDLLFYFLIIDDYVQMNPNDVKLLITA